MKLIECFQLLSVERLSLTAEEQGSVNNCVVQQHLSTYCDASLTPYSCPQPDEGSTCYSQSARHFFVHATS